MAVRKPESDSELSSGVAFDPLRGTWLLDFLDPWEPNHSPTALPWSRIVLFVATIFLPMVVFSSIPSTLAGGKLTGSNSFSTDMGMMGILFFLVIASSLLPYARRRFSGLVDDLIYRGLLHAEFKTNAPTYVKDGWIL